MKSLLHREAFGQAQCFSRLKIHLFEAQLQKCTMAYDERHMPAHFNPVVMAHTLQILDIRRFHMILST